MLDPKFKNLRLVSCLIDQEQGVSIVKEYDQWFIFPMLLKCYHTLHLIAKFGLMVDMQTDEPSSLDIFWDVCWN